MVSVSYQRIPIRCGKSRCRCNTDDQRRWHGPYWYAYWTDPNTGKQRSKYVGKHFDPPDGHEHTTHSERRAAPDPNEARERAERTRREAEERQAHERAERERQEREEQDARQHARTSRRGSSDEDDATCLGVSTGASQEELKKAWRRKVQKHHPDRYPEAERARQEVIAKNINSAYQRMLKRRGWR